MTDYTVTGNVVEHTAWPRCRFVFVPNSDGGWECFNPDWIDDPLKSDLPDGELALLCARVAREAGDAFSESRRS